MSFGSNQGAGTPGGGSRNGDAYEFDSSHQQAIEHENKTVPHVPADSAEYLGGELPKYAEGSNNWTAGANPGEPSIDVNSLVNSMDPSAGLD
jgi:hypothetical protein